MFSSSICYVSLFERQKHPKQGGTDRNKWNFKQKKITTTLSILVNIFEIL